MRPLATTVLLAAFAGALALGAPAGAARSGYPTPREMPAPPQPGLIELGPAVANPNAEQWETMGADIVVRNVSQATLQPIVPAPGYSNGVAVIVAPGGAFMGLSMQNEGWAVAHWLAAHGIVAFVLKYRLDPTPPDPADLARVAMVRVSNVTKSTGSLPDAGADPSATADGLAAIALVRHNAQSWGVDPRRVGFIGFSAGAILTERMALAPQPAARPNFAGVIYGPLTARPVPRDAPPLFIAMSADDPLMAQYGLGLVDGWRRAGRTVELHFYESGGHGFGMTHQGTTSDLWIDQFYAWLGALGLLKH